MARDGAMQWAKARGVAPLGVKDCTAAAGRSAAAAMLVQRPGSAVHAQGYSLPPLAQCEPDPQQDGSGYAEPPEHVAHPTIKGG